MRRTLLVRVVTLCFSSAVLTLAILHGCSKPSPGPAAAPDPAANAPHATPASATPTQQANAPAAEDDPPFLGASKAAVMVHPKPKASSSASK